MAEKCVMGLDCCVQVSRVMLRVTLDPRRAEPQPVCRPCFLQLTGNAGTKAREEAQRAQQRGRAGITIPKPQSSRRQGNMFEAPKRANPDAEFEKLFRR